MAGPLKQEAMNGGAIAAMLWGGILRFSCVQLQERGFLLPLHRHREANHPAFLLSDSGTHAIGGKAVLRAAVEVTLCYGTRKLLFPWGRRQGRERTQCGLFFHVFCCYIGWILCWWFCPHNIFHLTFRFQSHFCVNEGVPLSLFSEWDLKPSLPSAGVNMNDHIPAVWVKSK